METWIDIYFMLLAVQLVCYPVAVGGSNFILLSLLFYFCFYLWSKWGKNSSSINSSSWAFDSHWMCRTTLHSIPSSNICENFSFSYFNNSVLTCIYVLISLILSNKFFFSPEICATFYYRLFYGSQSSLFLPDFLCWMLWYSTQENVYTC